MSTQPDDIARDQEEAQAGKKTRRTEGLLKGERQERVVDSVLRATAEQLAKVGYGGLRVEDVATASGVNKTTIYRRWPSKSDLVKAALEEARAQKEVAETGDLRADLVATFMRSAAFAATPTGRGLVRVMQLERTVPEVEAIALEMRARHRGVRKEMIERAIARGELPEGCDPLMIAELVFSPLYTRVVVAGEPIEQEYAERLVDTVLAGVRAMAGNRA